MSKFYNVAFEACKILGLDIWPKDLAQHISDKYHKRRCNHCSQRTWHNEIWSNERMSTYECNVCNTSHHVNKGVVKWKP